MVRRLTARRSTCAVEFQARVSRVPQPWRTWLILAGRGWGKSRTGAEWVRAQVKAGLAGRIALIAPRRTCVM